MRSPLRPSLGTSLRDLGHIGGVVPQSVPQRSALGRPPAVGAHRHVDDVQPGERLLGVEDSAPWRRDARRRASSSMVMTAL